MPSVNASITIQVPVEEAFDFAASPSRTPMFVPNLSENTDLSTETTEVGQTWSWRFNLLGLDLKGKGETTLVEPNSKWQLKSTGDASSTWTYTYAKEGDGTRVTIDVDYTLPESVLGKLGPAKKALAAIQQQTADNALDNLKTILES